MFMFAFVAQVEDWMSHAKIPAPYMQRGAALHFGIDFADSGSGIYHSIYYVLKGRVSRASSLDDLLGRVSIKTKAHALAYVRVFTSPLTFHWGRLAPHDYKMVEPIPQVRVRISDFWGAEEPYDFAKTVRKSRQGIWVGPWPKGALKEPVVSKVKTGFEVRRFVMIEEWLDKANPIRGYNIVQRINFDGAYEEVSREPVEDLIGAEGIFWPLSSGSEGWWRSYF